MPKMTEATMTAILAGLEKLLPWEAKEFSSGMMKARVDDGVEEVL